MIRSVWASPAGLAVIQFQDLLDLGNEDRMNTPSTLGGNWRWRTLTGTFDESLSRWFFQETQIYCHSVSELRPVSAPERL